MTYAYDQTLLYKARISLGWMFDYAVYEMKMSLSSFFTMFINSDVSDKFGRGDSSTVAGKSGIELAYQVIRENDENKEFIKPGPSPATSPEYWLGWSLAYYQWKRNVSFRQISEKVDIYVMLGMYDKYHEMDIEHFVIEIDRLINEDIAEPQLKRLRMYAMLSQSELAKKSGIPLRTIQQYEQKQKNINNAKAETVIQLAQALYCRPEELLEI